MEEQSVLAIKLSLSLKVVIDIINTFLVMVRIMVTLDGVDSLRG
jgi:hypothetical protein